MEALGQFLTSLFSRPRLTWAALAVTSAVLLLMQRFGVGIEPQAALAQSANLVCWVMLALSSSFLVLTTIVDVWKSQADKVREIEAHKKERADFLAASPHARAILFYMVMNSENCIYISPDYVGLSDFIVRRFGYISGRNESSIEVECSTRPYNWLRDNLTTLTDDNVGIQARADLITSIKRAAQVNTGFGY